jgi:hypothetical protein
MYRRGCGYELTSVDVTVRLRERRRVCTLESHDLITESRYWLYIPKLLLKQKIGKVKRRKDDME